MDAFRHGPKFQQHTSANSFNKVTQSLSSLKGMFRTSNNGHWLKRLTVSQVQRNVLKYNSSANNLAHQHKSQDIRVVTLSACSSDASITACVKDRSITCKRNNQQLSESNPLLESWEPLMRLILIPGTKRARSRPPSFPDLLLPWMACCLLSWVKFIVLWTRAAETLSYLSSTIYRARRFRFLGSDVSWTINRNCISFRYNARITWRWHDETSRPPFTNGVWDIQQCGMCWFMASAMRR